MTLLLGQTLLDCLVKSGSGLHKEEERHFTLKLAAKVGQQGIKLREGCYYTVYCLWPC